jgi:FAD:protein FMN transferase
MGMPITIEITGKSVKDSYFQLVFDYFQYIDEIFSTHKKTSEISRYNNGLLTKNKLSFDVIKILDLAELTKKETKGYFDIKKGGKIDPSGIVKGWGILNAAKLLWKKGLHDFYIEAGGDIQVSGKNSQGSNWIIGIRNPFNRFENIKILSITNRGVATSGTAVRGQHIYNPFSPKDKIEDIVSITVIGPNVYEADRFATSAFAMGKKGIEFIEKLEGFEGYMIDSKKIATYTAGFDQYIKKI